MKNMFGQYWLLHLLLLVWLDYYAIIEIRMKYSERKEVGQFQEGIAHLYWHTYNMCGMIRLDSNRMKLLVIQFKMQMQEQYCYMYMHWYPSSSSRKKYFFQYSRQCYIIICTDIMQMFRFTECWHLQSLLSCFLKAYLPKPLSI